MCAPTNLSAHQWASRRTRNISCQKFQIYKLFHNIFAVEMEWWTFQDCIWKTFYLSRVQNEQNVPQNAGVRVWSGWVIFTICWCEMSLGMIIFIHFARLCLHEFKSSHMAPFQKRQKKFVFPFLVTLCSGIVFALFQIPSRNGFLCSIVEEGHKRYTHCRQINAIWEASARTFKFRGRYARRISMKIRLFSPQREFLTLNHIFQFLAVTRLLPLTCWARVLLQR